MGKMIKSIIEFFIYFISFILLLFASHEGNITGEDAVYGTILALFFGLLSDIREVLCKIRDKLPDKKI
jgi:cell shape-determining protein MreC